MFFFKYVLCVFACPLPQLLLLLLHTRVVLFLLSFLSLYQLSEYISKNKKRIKQKYPHKLASENQPTTTTNLKKSKKKTIASLMPLIRYLCFLVFPFLHNIWGSFSNAFLFYDFFVLKKQTKMNL